MSSSSHPPVRAPTLTNSDGPTRRRTFTPAQKLEHLAGYEKACQSGQGGAYQRRERVYSSLISEGHRLRDAGGLAGKEPGEAIGAPSRVQAEIARLSRGWEVSERQLVTTQNALAHG